MRKECSLPGIRQIIHLDSTESTQTLAKAMADYGCDENTAIIADSQTSGYGRLDHKWSSSPGGLYISVLLRPETNPAYFADLSGITASVLADIFRNEYALQAKVKLPNDVYVFCEKTKKWLKISGILSETATAHGEKSEWLIIGIGVNINNTDFPKTAVSLCQLTDRKVEVMDFASMFFRHFWPKYYAWECGSRMRS